MSKVMELVEKYADSIRFEASYPTPSGAIGMEVERLAIQTEVERMEQEIQELRRFRSTNAPRITALEGLLATANAKVAQGKEAIASLQSERDANAILTDEIAALRKELHRVYIAEPLSNVNEIMARSTK